MVVDRELLKHVLFFTYSTFAIIALASCIRDAVHIYSHARLMALSARAPIVIDGLRGTSEGDGM